MQTGSSVAFCPSLLPVGAPTQLPHSHEPASTSSSTIHLSILSLAPSTTNKPHQQRLNLSASPPCPRLAAQYRSSPAVTLDREDGEGRGAKDTAGVHPRRLRRPHLGPRCRSRYVMPLGSLPLTPPSSTGLVRTRIHCCWQPSPAQPRQLRRRPSRP